MKTDEEILVIALSTGQMIATLLGTTCCVRLATVLQCVATCWVLLAQV